MPRREATPFDPETLFDAYLDAALSGRAEDPDAFLARHPEADDDLARRIRAIHVQMAQRGPVDEALDDGARRIGPFRLLERLGAGGMGVVWKAVQEPLGRAVALKVLRADLDTSPEALERLRREARTLAQLDHPGIVRVIAAGEADGVRYLAMELVRGTTLDRLLVDHGGPVPTPRVLRWGVQMARALAYAHERGVVHRDVKPSNVLIDENDDARLVDFGVARDTAASLPTLTGPFIGSPAYAPPEQLTGDRVDGRADVHALGATLYRCLTGAPAFDGATVDQVIHQVLHTAPTPPSRRVQGLSRDLDLVLGKALAKRPEKRYPDAGAFADDLDALLSFRPVSVRPPRVHERLRSAAVAHPVATAILTTLVVVGLLAGSWAAYDAAATRGERRREARALIEQAGEQLDGYRTGGARLGELTSAVTWRRNLLESQYLTDEQLADLDARERELSDVRRERETALYEVLALVGRAERLDPAVEGAGRLRAAVFAEKHAEALGRRDRRTAAFYADLVLSAEPDGDHAAAVRGKGRVTLTATAPGIELHLFRYEELADLVPGGARRSVPVPHRGASPGFAPGTITTRTVDGGTDTRPTAAPLDLGERSRLGSAPLEQIELARGEYLVAALRDGRIVARGLFTIDPARPVSVHLTIPDRRVPGCVLIPAPAEEEESGPFWIMEREVTCAEYLAFLNDPATLAAVDASEAPIRFPRAGENRTSGGYWRRGADGRFALADDWEPDWPVLGVSWDDATAYARWRSKADPDHDFALPTLAQALAAAGEPHRRYAFGDHFRPRFASSCFTHAAASPAPVMSHPIDESPFGVYDLAGSASEWCADWYDERQNMRRVNWGNWGSGDPDRFHLWAAMGWPADRATGTVGFRLVVTPRESGR